MYDFVNEAAVITNRDRSNLIQHQSGGKSKTGTTKPKLISTWLTLNIRENTAYKPTGRMDTIQQSR